jgi:hypothetical protein
VSDLTFFFLIQVINLDWYPFSALERRICDFWVIYSDIFCFLFGFLYCLLWNFIIFFRSSAQNGALNYTHRQGNLLLTITHHIRHHFMGVSPESFCMNIIPFLDRRLPAILSLSQIFLLRIELRRRNYSAILT